MRPGYPPRTSAWVMRLWKPHDLGRSCLRFTIRHRVTNETESQNAGALSRAVAPPPARTAGGGARPASPGGGGGQPVPHQGRLLPTQEPAQLAQGLDERVG